MKNAGELAKALREYAGDTAGALWVDRVILGDAADLLDRLATAQRYKLDDWQGPFIRASDLEDE